MTRACCSPLTPSLHQGWKWVRAIPHTSPLCLHRPVKERNRPFPTIMLSIYSTWYALPNLTVGLTSQRTVGKQDKKDAYSAGSSFVPFFWGQLLQDMLKYTHTLLLPLLLTHRLDQPHSASLHMDLQNIKQKTSKHTHQNICKYQHQSVLGVTTSGETGSSNGHK